MFCLSIDSIERAVICTFVRFFATKLDYLLLK